MAAVSSFSLISTLKLLLILKFSLVYTTGKEYEYDVVHTEPMMKKNSFLLTHHSTKLASKSGMRAVRESRLKVTETSEETQPDLLDKSGPIKTVSLPPFQTLKKHLAGSTFTAIRLPNGSQSYEIDRTIPPNRPQEKAVLDEILSVFRNNAPHQATGIAPGLRQLHNDNHPVRLFSENYRDRMVRSESTAGKVYGDDSSSRKINYCRPNSLVNITYSNVSPWTSQTYTTRPRVRLNEQDYRQGCRLPGFPPDGRDCCGPGCCPSFSSSGTPCQWPNCKETTESCCCPLEAGRWEPRAGYPSNGFNGPREHGNQPWCPCGCYEQTTPQRFPVPANYIQQSRPAVPRTSGRWAKRLTSGYWPKQRPTLYPITTATRPSLAKHFRGDDYQRNKTRIIYGGSYRPSYYSISDAQPFFSKPTPNSWGEVPKFSNEPGPTETQARSTTQMSAAHSGMPEDWRKMSIPSQSQSYENAPNRRVLAIYSADKHVEHQSSAETLQWPVQEDQRTLRSSQQRNAAEDQMANSREAGSASQIQPITTHQLQSSSTDQHPQPPVLLPCSEENSIDEPIQSPSPLSSPDKPS